MEIDFPYELSDQDARGRLDILSTYLANKHGIQVTWIDAAKARFSGKYLVVRIDGELTLGNGHARFRGEDPGLPVARPRQGIHPGQARQVPRPEERPRSASDVVAALGSAGQRWAAWGQRRGSVAALGATFGARPDGRPLFGGSPRRGDRCWGAAVWGAHPGGAAAVWRRCLGAHPVGRPLLGAAVLGSPRWGAPAACRRYVPPGAALLRGGELTQRDRQGAICRRGVMPWRSSRRCRRSMMLHRDRSFCAFIMILTFDGLCGSNLVPQPMNSRQWLAPPGCTAAQLCQTWLAHAGKRTRGRGVAR